MPDACAYMCSPIDAADHKNKRLRDGGKNNKIPLAAGPRKVDHLLRSGRYRQKQQ